ncbi:RNA polymerase sigma factor [Aeoliella sp.]|uniref:RNA polymerase sigma factor n=1 Tax=Aeoliella sp. TaxID=2795800 RepID=UPI003CCBB59B
MVRTLRSRLFCNCTATLTSSQDVPSSLFGYFARLRYSEIADVTHIPEGTVGSRLNRARRELQRHLGDLGWER